MANTNDVTFEIVEHIGTIDVIDGREEKWTKEVNVVAWNGGKPKIDRRRISGNIRACNARANSRNGGNAHV